MDRTSFRLGLAIAATLGIAALSYMAGRDALPSDTAAISVPPSADVATGEVLLPKRLTIESIGIDAPIVPVGQTKKGAMRVPEDPRTVGWYAYGAKPGEKGSAVLAGHKNTAYTSHGIFFDLSKVKVGDEIEVETENGDLVRFVVRETAEYPYDASPIAKIFGSSSGTFLNLITCAGEWENTTYSKRLVVYAEMTQHVAKN